MTRLKSTDIEHLTAELRVYDERLRLSTGMSLGELACSAAGVSADVLARTGEIRVAAVPVTSGQGVILKFSRTLAAIASFLGFSAGVTEQADIAGIGEAYNNAGVLLAADDNMFCAINIKNGTLIDNSEATGRGFAHGLAGLASVRDRLAGKSSNSFVGKTVLVLGCGPVGMAGMRAVTELGGSITLYDPDTERSRKAVATLTGQSGQAENQANIQLAADIDEALAEHDLILEATPVADVVLPGHVRATTCIAAPGVPCGVSADAATLIGRQLLWDPLQIGVSTMLMAAAFATKKWSSS